MTMPNAEMVKRILPNATGVFEIKIGGQIRLCYQMDLEIV